MPLKHGTLTLPGDLKQLVTETRKRLGSDNAREVHDALTRPQLVRVPRKVTTPKDAETLTWETMALAEIEAFLFAVTGDKSNPLPRLAAINSLQMLAAVRKGKKDKPDKAEDIGARSDALVLLYLDAQRRGYEWPLPDHFGQPEKVIDSFLDSPGPSLVEMELPGTPVPTMAEVAAMME